MQMRRTRKPSRRYVRISLRTLFVVTTLCAIWLGCRCKRAHDQRIAVNRILELRGRVVYDYQYDTNRRNSRNAKPSGPIWLRRFVGDDYFQEVRCVLLCEVVRTDDDVEIIGTDVTDADFRLIGKLRHLRELSLYGGGNVSNAGLRHLGRLRDLQCLALEETRITDAGLCHLRDLKNLSELKLMDTAVGDEGLKHVGELTQLSVLNLDNTFVTSAGLSHLTRLKNLLALSLENAQIDDSAIQHLTAMRSLSYLNLTGTNVSQEGLLAIRSALPSCDVH